MNEQIELDSLYNKIAVNYEKINDKELTRLIELINNKFNGYDLILFNLSQRELIRNTDYITRAAYELTKRKGLFDTSSKHYILNNLWKGRNGLESHSRKKIFQELQLAIGDEIDCRKVYVKFKFYAFEKPILLMKHSYGINSITNIVETILKQIEEAYLLEIGYSLEKDNVAVYYKDPAGFVPHYDQVTFEKGLIDPKWEPIDSEWFEEEWDSVVVEQIDEDEAVFLQKGQEYTAYLKMKEIFNKAKRRIQVIDPYLDSVFLSLVEGINSKVQIQGITESLKGDFDTAYKKMKIERGNIEVIKSKNHHDRFVIIDQKTVYVIGSSLNKLGNKPSLIFPMENKLIKESIMKYFNDTWHGNSNQNSSNTATQR